MKKLLFIFLSIALITCTFLLPSSAYNVSGDSPYYVANQPIYCSFSYALPDYSRSIMTSLPDYLPDELEEYSDDCFILGNRATADFTRWEQSFVGDFYSSHNSFTEIEIGVAPFVYRADDMHYNAPQLDIEFSATSLVNYQLDYDIDVYTIDGRFVDSYSGGTSGATVDFLSLSSTERSLSDLIFSNFRSDYVYFINSYSLRVWTSTGSFGLLPNTLVVSSNYRLTDSPSRNYELLTVDDVPAEIFLEDIGVGNIIWNSIVDIFNTPLVADFSLGAIFLACVAVPLLIMFLKLVLGG